MSVYVELTNYEQIQGNIIMKKIFFVFFVGAILSTNCFAAEKSLKLPKIDRRPNPTNWGRGELNSLPKYNPESTSPFQVDLRCYDLSKLDLSNSINDLLYATFDDRTVWPASEHIPMEFDWKQFMEMGKNPGLGIRSLHEQGITGRGVGIALIDNPLLVDHQEYAERLRLYEEIGIREMRKVEGGHGMDAHMHGTAVVSLATGKTLGVAPEADVYYVATWPFVFDKKGGGVKSSFKHRAQAVLRILEINKHLPKDEKIRVISMSIGWGQSQEGYKEIAEATQKAKAAGMLVICSSTEQIHGFRFHGLDRLPLANSDDFNSYKPGSWWAKMFYQVNLSHIGMNSLLVPMDSRTTASPTGTNEYVFYRHGGWSWSIPYIAGVYALAAQVEPNITPERFWALAMKTGRTIELENKERKIAFGPILDSAKIIESLKKGELSDSKAVKAELDKYNINTDSTVPNNAEFLKDINIKVAQLDINKATRQDVISIFGKPLSYKAYKVGWHTFKEDNLPKRYSMVYPEGFSIFMIGDHVGNLHFKKPGYSFRNKIQCGSSLEEFFEVLGSPAKTMEKAKKSKISQFDVLYKDIDGRKGHCYYASRDHGIGAWFMGNEVIELVVRKTKPIIEKR